MTETTRTAPVRRRIAGAAVVCAAMFVGVASLPQASAAPSVTPSAPVAAGRTTHRIDISDRTAVRDAYLSRLVPAVQTPTGWTGSTATCTLGTESGESRRATRDAVNFYRAMVGVGPVSLDMNWSTKALRAALMMDAADQLTHYPNSSWPCSTSDGIVAAGKSNLFWSSCCSGAVSVPSYIIDEGPTNDLVGHRRWLLNPEISRIGVGSTRQANAIWVVPDNGDPSTSGPSWIAWPPAGFVPMPLVAGADASGPQKTLGRWSMSTRSSVNADFGRAQVQARLVDGRPLVTTVEYRDTNRAGLGSALVWNISRPTGRFPITKPVNVKISITGIRVGNSTVSKSYTVRLFPVFPPTTPVTTLSASPGTLEVSWSAAKERGAPITGYTVRIYRHDPYTTSPIATRSLPVSQRSIRVKVTPRAAYYAMVVAESAAGSSAIPTRASGVFIS
jgi:uncharacterized protein YkwD